MRVARAVDAAARDPAEAAFARVATALGKFWLCRRAAGFVNEAQECLGGAGYVGNRCCRAAAGTAQFDLEGGGSVQGLDVLRAGARTRSRGRCCCTNWSRRVDMMPPTMRVRCVAADKARAGGGDRQDLRDWWTRCWGLAAR